MVCSVTLLLSLGGCKKDSARRLRDTEGRTFEATCLAGAPCQLKQTEGPVRNEKPAQQLLLGGRLVGVCDVRPGASPDGPFDCRPLRCRADADCPPLHGMKEGQCLHEHCSDAAESVSVQDAILLCLAGTGLGRENARQIERYALALNCGTPCAIPAPCEQL